MFTLKCTNNTLRDVHETLVNVYLKHILKNWAFFSFFWTLFYSCAHGLPLLWLYLSPPLELLWLWLYPSVWLGMECAIWSLDGFWEPPLGMKILQIKRFCVLATFTKLLFSFAARLKSHCGAGRECWYSCWPMLFAPTSPRCFWILLTIDRSDFLVACWYPIDSRIYWYSRLKYRYTWPQPIMMCFLPVQHSPTCLN